MDDETRKLLSAAKGVVSQGWCQGTLNTDSGDVCLMGAVFEASDESPRSRGIAVAFDVLCEAAHLSLTSLPSNYKHPLADWNDAPERTQEEVVALFDKALTETATPVVRELITA